MKKFWMAISVLAFVFLASCGEKTEESDGLMRFAGDNAAYVAEFPMEADGVIVCECVRSGSVTQMRVTSPENCVGLAVRYDGATCSLACGEGEILLSADVASGVTTVFDILARTDGGTVAKSADGSQTVVTYEDGSVTIGADGIPVEITLTDASAARVIKIKSWSPSE